MFIDCFDNNGGKYLRLVRSVRTEKDDGRKTTSKIPVFNIGPLAKFDDGEPNYLERLRQSFRNGHPLIPALLPYVKAIVPQKYSVEFVFSAITDAITWKNDSGDSSISYPSWVFLAL